VIDFYRYTETELKKLLQSITIVVDTRENSNKPIIDYFEAKKIPYVVQKLDYCVYQVS
jgi:hypothetical protein